MHTRTTPSSGVQTRPRTEPQAPQAPGLCRPTAPGQPGGSHASRELRPTTRRTVSSGEGPGRTLPGLPAANRCESGASAWGLGPVSALFLWGERTLPPPPPGPPLLPCPRTEALDPQTPTPLSQVSFCVSRGGGGRHCVVQCIIFKLLCVWVSVCMKWNKLCPPPAPSSCVPELPWPHP